MKSIVLIAAAMVVAACSGGPPVETRSVDARVMTGNGVRAGDCVEARRRAAEKPDLDVERLPAVTAQTPRPFQRMPTNVRTLVNSQGASVKASVIIDTLGRPVMSSFKIEESKPHAWLGQNIRSIVPRWKFSPAELAGCKVPRVYKFSATSPKQR